MTATEIIPNADAAVAETTATAGTGQRTDGASGAVWAALAANPGAAVTVIAKAAGVSKSTAARALTTMEKEGRAARTLGLRDGRTRTPDAWHPVDDQAVADASVTAETAPADSGPSKAEEPPTTASDEADDGDTMDPAAVSEARVALTGIATAINSALKALDASDRATAIAETEKACTGVAKTRRLVRIAVNGRPRSASGRAKSHPGELRTKVAAHLATHPELEFTPHEIGKVIGHSPGAIANALERLTELGEAALTCERPRRFSFGSATETS